MSDVTPPKPPTPKAAAKGIGGKLKNQPKWVWVAGATVLIGVAFLMWKRGRNPQEEVVVEDAGSPAYYPTPSQGAYGGYDSPGGGFDDLPDLIVPPPVGPLAPDPTYPPLPLPSGPLGDDGWGIPRGEEILVAPPPIITYEADPDMPPSRPWLPTGGGNPPKSTAVHRPPPAPKYYSTAAPQAPPAAKPGPANVVGTVVKTVMGAPGNFLAPGQGKGGTGPQPCPPQWPHRSDRGCYKVVQASGKGKKKKGRWHYYSHGPEIYVGP